MKESMKKKKKIIVKLSQLLSKSCWEYESLCYTFLSTFFCRLIKLNENRFVAAEQLFSTSNQFALSASLLIFRSSNKLQFFALIIPKLLLVTFCHIWWHLVTFIDIWWHLLTFGGNLWHMYDLTLATLFNNSITFIKQVFDKISNENFWYMTFPYWTPFEFHCDTLYMFLRSVTHSLNGSCLDYRVPFRMFEWFHFDQQCFVVLAREHIIRVTWYLIWVPPITLTISINMR